MSQRPDTMPCFRFLHASDLHFGSKQYEFPALAEDYIDCFRHLLKMAHEKHVDCVILGGDIFSSVDLLPNQFERILTLLDDFHHLTAHSIPIIAIEGNHDLKKYSHSTPLLDDQSWIRVFASFGYIILLRIPSPDEEPIKFQEYSPETHQGSKIRIKNTIIYGTQYLKHVDTLIPQLYQAIPPKAENYHILLQHFGIKGQMKNVPGLEYNLIKPLHDRVDYLALGHYHLGFTLDHWVYNPGAPEAVSASEHEFKRGVFFVEVFHSSVGYTHTVQHLSFQNRPYFWFNVFMTHSLHSDEEFFALLLQKCHDLRVKSANNIPPLGEKLPVIYLVLTGNPPSTKVTWDERRINKILCPVLSCAAIKVYAKFVEKPIVRLDQYFRNSPALQSVNIDE